ncbi:MAG: hypothetical protein GY870_13800 [archaeon]|nr:hypothetical protein [archaeon]
MIHAIYVIHQFSGVCVLYNKYGTIEFNEDLIAGFLTALKDFSSEVTGGKGNIKVLDMVIYYIHLVFKEGVLIAVASDKKDSKEIVQNKLEIILSEFLKRHGQHLENWSGDVRMFKDFSKYLDDVLEKGLAAEVARELPLLRLFEKYHKKEEKNLKKGATLDGSALEKMTTRDWLNKRLPKQYISQGILTQSEYELAHQCDGFRDVTEIAEKAGITAEQAQIVIEKLKRQDMIKFIKT